MTNLILFFAAAVLPSADGLNTPDQPRRLTEMNNDLRSAIRAEATAKNGAQRGNAIRQMATLYQEFSQDERLAISPELQRYKVRLWNRLIKIKKDLQREIAYARKNQKRAAIHDKAKSVLDEPADQITSQASNSLTAQLTLVSYSLGGPGQFIATRNAALAGGAGRDDGRALVELIERTISPNSWAVNGGPGTIIYYAPLHALVVRATSEMHGRVGGLFKGLRKAGR